MIFSLRNPLVFQRHTLARGLSVMLLAVLLWQAAPPAQALPVTGLYEETIAVENQNESQRQQAYRQAFQQVLVKVTGETRWLEHPAITRALGMAASYVSQVSYRSGPEGGALSVQFDQALVDELLSRENIPVWDNNRASILLWLTLQSADGRRVVLGSGSENDLILQAENFAERRAVPVLLPILDLTDRRLVTQQQGWALDTDALQRAAQRYGADSILAGRVLETPDGQLVGLWRVLFRESNETFDHLDSVENDYMSVPLDQATAMLANYFGLVPSAFDQRDSVRIRISGINSMRSHQEAMNYLSSLSMVERVSLRALDANTMELELELAGTRQMLSEFISLGRDLQPDNFTPGANLPQILNFRWTR
jgi:hypothetical protein